MKLKHILSTQQFLDRKMLQDIFRIADNFGQADRRGKIPKILPGKNSGHCIL